MERRILNEFVTFVPGINSTRVQKQFEDSSISYYDQAAFDSDYNYEDGSGREEVSDIFSEDLSLAEGDVVISNSLQLATIVGKGNSGKIPSLNFTKVVFDSEVLDKHYFIYLFNAYSDVKRQKERELQGTGAILRIPIKALRQIVIPFVPLVEQQKIGRAYHENLKLQSKLSKYTALMEKFVGSVLEENLKERR